MFPYWLLFAIVAVGALTERTYASNVRRPGLILLGIFIALMIGLRVEVGADYWTYLRLFEYASHQRLSDALRFGEPAHQVLNWAIAQADYDQWVANLVSASIFSWGLIRFVRSQPTPWMTLLVAVPYLIIVVAMGYTRQSVAIGLIMAGLPSVLRGGSVLKFTLYVAVAATFHRTAVMVLPLVLLAGQRNRLINLIAGTAILIFLYDLMLAESIDYFVESYLEAEYASQGAAVRVAMSAIPALIFLFTRKRLGFVEQEAAVWRLFSLVALAMIPVLILTPSSAAVDRMALYLLPLQLAVIPRMVYLVANVNLARLGIILYCFTIQFMWLNFAAHATYWLPYDFVLPGEELPKRERIRR